MRVVDRLGRRALLVRCSDGDDVLALAAHLVAAPLPGQREVVPAARTVLVTFDGPPPDTVRRAAGAADPPPATTSPADEVVLDTVYDGPDLTTVARATGRSAESLVTEHTATTWTSAFLGFAPGFAYLLPPQPWDVPRRDTPRTEVPAGSVALAGPFSAVYPRRSPGGWQLVGRTDTPLWDVDRAPPALLVPGTPVRFRAVRATTTVHGGARASTPAPPPTGRPTQGLPAGRVLEVLTTGPQVLVQDLGRSGHLAVGVPRSGALDRGAAVRANRLVGNPRGTAVLEVVLGGVQVRARDPLVLALTGACCPVRLLDGDGVERVPPGYGRPFALPRDHTLVLDAPPQGLRTYLAVRGGVDAPAVLGSRSTDVLSGLGPPAVRPGDVLPVGPPPGDAVADVPGPPDEQHGAQQAGCQVTVHLVPGPQASWLTDGARRRLHGSWVVGSRADRVGVRLEGARLERSVHDELPSAGLVPGAVQVPPDGHPVVFLADHPVTGGYPVVATVLEDDLDVLAQVRPGDTVHLTSACDVRT